MAILRGKCKWREAVHVGKVDQTAVYENRLDDTVTADCARMVKNCPKLVLSLLAAIRVAIEQPAHDNVAVSILNAGGDCLLSARPPVH